MLKTTLKLLSFVGFGIAVGWVYFEPRKYDSWVAASAALVVFLGLFLPDALRQKGWQHQQTGEGSTGVQAGGNITINVNSNQEKS